MITKAELEKLIKDLGDDSLAPGETLPIGIGFDSSKTISALASFRIDDLEIEDIPLVKELFFSIKDSSQLEKICSILIRLAMKYDDSEIIHIIIERLNLKTDKILNLGALNYLPNSFELSKHSDIILKFINVKNFKIRHTAIRLLGLYKTEVSKIEDHLIQILNSSNDKYDLYYTNMALQKIGTIKSIESLKNVIQNRMEVEVKTTAIAALGKIDGKNQVNFFLKIYVENKNSFVKSTLTKFIAEYSDEGSIDILIDRIKTILSRKRELNWIYSEGQFSEIINILKYLLKFEKKDSRIPKLINWILNDKIYFLDQIEINWINENINANRY